MTQAELNEFEAENDELIAMFQRRQPTMDTVTRMFPNLAAEPVIDDMPIIPAPNANINPDAAFEGAIWLAMLMIFLIIIFGWLL